MNLAQLPTWLMERATPIIKELQTPADVERKQERRRGERWGKKETEVLVSFKEKDTLTASLPLKRTIAAR